MIHTLAGLGFLVVLAIAISGLAVYLWRLPAPRWFFSILWTLPAAPFVMVACFAVFVITYPIGA